MGRKTASSKQTFRQSFSYFKHKTLLTFLGKAVLLYCLWYVIYEIWLHPIGAIDQAVIAHTIDLSAWALRSLGYTVFTEGRLLIIANTEGLRIGDPCNGLDLFALFSGFVLAYPGSFWKKLVFIPAGILIIHVLNIMRICALSLILVYAPEYVPFNHTYTFTFIVYGFIFVLWMIWANKWGGKLTQ